MMRYLGLITLAALALAPLTGCISSEKKVYKTDTRHERESTTDIRSDTTDDDASMPGTKKTTVHKHSETIIER